MNKALKKTITWNVFATLSCTIGVRLYTGDWNLTPILLFFSLIYFPITYLIHEMLWRKEESCLDWKLLVFLSKYYLRYKFKQFRNKVRKWLG